VRHGALPESDDGLDGSARDDRGDLGIDACGRWVRGATRVGSAYAERPGLGLTLLR